MLVNGIGRLHAYVAHTIPVSFVTSFGVPLHVEPPVPVAVGSGTLRFV